MHAIITLKADIELESKWTARHQAMGRTAMAEASRMRVDNMQKRLDRLQSQQA